MLTLSKEHILPLTSSLLPRGLVEYIGEMAFPTVLAVMHSSHEDTGTTLVESQLMDENVTKVKMRTSAVGHSLLKRSILPSPSTL